MLEPWAPDELRAPALSLSVDAAWQGIVTPAARIHNALLAEYHGKLVLAGDLTAAGAQSAGGVVLWDGSTFETLPSVGTVSAVTVWNDRIVVVGPSSTGRVPILSFNGATWDTLGSANSSVNTLQVFGAKLVIGGQFASVSGVPAARVAAFDGSNWAALGSGPAGTAVNCLTLHAGQLLAGGSLTPNTVVAWDPIGGVWAPVGAGLTRAVISLASDGVDLYAAGTQTLSTTLTAMARWNGVAWSLAIFDGVTWSSVILPWQTGMMGPVMWNILDIREWAGRLVAAGFFPLCADGDRFVVTNRIASWDGSHWAPLGGGVAALGFVLSEYEGDLVVGGLLPSFQGTSIQRLGRWNGVSWSGFGLTTNVPDLIDVIQTLARFDGTEWRVLGSGSNSTLFAAHGGYLYQVGSGIVHGQVSHNLTRAPLATVLGAPRPRAGGPAIALTASPNPAHRSTTLSFSLAIGGHAKLQVLDLAGRVVATLVDADFAAGPHRAIWSAAATPGVYFARLETATGLSRVARVVRVE